MELNLLCQQQAAPEVPESIAVMAIEGDPVPLGYGIASVGNRSRHLWILFRQLFFAENGANVMPQRLFVLD